MSSEGSVAPKERVNIRYRPAVGDAKEEVELPHKLLMIDDFTGQDDATPIAERKRIDVNKDTFNEVMRNQHLSVNLKVANQLSSDPDAGDLAVSLSFATLADFEPERVVMQVPQMQALLELRHALTALKGPLGNVPAFRKAIEQLLADPQSRDRFMAEIGQSGTTTGSTA
jgi:type VI secretion system protein ImpB